MQFWEKFALTTVQIALGFASCNFPVAIQFFPKSHSRPCDYLYKSTLKRNFKKETLNLLNLTQLQHYKNGYTWDIRVELVASRNKRHFSRAGSSEAMIFLYI